MGWQTTTPPSRFGVQIDTSAVLEESCSPYGPRRECRTIDPEIGPSSPGWETTKGMIFGCSEEDALTFANKLQIKNRLIQEQLAALQAPQGAHKRSSWNLGKALRGAEERRRAVEVLRGAVGASTAVASSPSRRLAERYAAPESTARAPAHPSIAAGTESAAVRRAREILRGRHPVAARDALTTMAPTAEDSVLACAKPPAAAAAAAFKNAPRSGRCAEEAADESLLAAALRQRAEGERYGRQVAVLEAEKAEIINAINAANAECDRLRAEAQARSRMRSLEDTYLVNPQPLRKELVQMRDRVQRRSEEVQALRRQISLSTRVPRATEKLGLALRVVTDEGILNEVLLRWRHEVRWRDHQEEQVDAEGARVTFAVTIEGLKHDDVIKNPALTAQLQQQVAAAVASEAGPGVASKHIEIVLRPGSVIADVTITPVGATAAGLVLKRLRGSRSLYDTVEEHVSAVLRRASLFVGPVHVPRITAPRLQLPAPQPEPDGADASATAAGSEEATAAKQGGEETAAGDGAASAFGGGGIFGWIAGLTQAEATHAAYKPGDAVEIFSNSEDKWCRGKIIEVDAEDVVVEYMVSDGNRATKRIPTTSDQLKRLPFKVGDPVEVLSESRWCRGKVTDVSEEGVLVEYTAEDGSTSTQRLQASSEHLKRLSGVVPILYECGDLIEVFSLSQDQWMCGKVVEVTGGEVLVEYISAEGRHGTKRISMTSQHLKHSDGTEEDRWSEFDLWSGAEEGGYDARKILAETEGAIAKEKDRLWRARPKPKQKVATVSAAAGRLKQKRHAKREDGQGRQAQDGGDNDVPAAGTSTADVDRPGDSVSAVTPAVSRTADDAGDTADGDMGETSTVGAGALFKLAGMFGKAADSEAQPPSSPADGIIASVHEAAAEAVFSVGEAVQVFSNSESKWLYGKVTEVVDTDVRVEYYLPDGTKSAKSLLNSSEHLKRSDGREPVYRVGDAVQIFSVSQDQWLYGKVAKVCADGDVLVEYTAPSGNRAAKEVSPFSESLKPSDGKEPPAVLGGSGTKQMPANAALAARLQRKQGRKAQQKAEGRVSAELAPATSSPAPDVTLSQQGDGSDMQIPPASSAAAPLSTPPPIPSAAADGARNGADSDPAGTAVSSASATAPAPIAADDGDAGSRPVMETVAGETASGGSRSVGETAADDASAATSNLAAASTRRIQANTGNNARQRLQQKRERRGAGMAA